MSRLVPMLGRTRLSSLLLFAGLELGLIDDGNLSVKASNWGVVVGGALLGIGFAVAGYCPGTGLCAAATGRFDAIIFIIGGLDGAFVFALMYKKLKAMGLMNDLFEGKVTLADTGVEAYTTLPVMSFEQGWLMAAVLAIALIGFAVILPKSLIKKSKT